MNFDPNKEPELKVPVDMVSLSEEIYTALRIGTKVPSSVSKLYDLVEIDNLSDVRYFAVSISSVADNVFTEEELKEYYDEEDPIITDELRVEYMWQQLSRAIEEPDEGTAASIHWTRINTAENEKYYLGCFVTIEGYAPVMDWIGAFLSVEIFYKHLKSMGYLLSVEQLAEISDKEFLHHWNRQ